MAAQTVILVIGARVTAAMAGIQKVYGGLNGLTQKVTSFGAMKIPALLGMATAGLGIGGVATKVLTLGANAEKTRLTFQTMLGSVAKGDAMMTRLDRFSNSTPYSGDQVNRAAKTLMAFGVAGGDVEDTLRMIGDVAAGSGKDFNDLSAIFGKVFAKGKADSEALNQIVEAGIPIIEMLGKKYQKNGDEIYDMASKGQISAKDISNAFAEMSGSGGVYADMMAKQSNTVSGMWGAITGQLEYAGALIGESIEPLVKSVLSYFQGWADELVAMSQDGRMVRYLAMVAYTGIDMGVSIAKWLNVVWQTGKMVFEQIGNIGKFIWSGIQGSAIVMFVSVIEWFNTFYEYGYAVIMTYRRLWKAGFDFVLAAVSFVFVGICDIVLKSINFVIGALNKIPGVDIKTVERPAFVGQVKEFAKESAKSAIDELAHVATGADFVDAKINIQKKNNAWRDTKQLGYQKIEEGGEAFYKATVAFGGLPKIIQESNKKLDVFGAKAKNKIGTWQASQEDRLAKQRRSADTTKLERGKGPSAAPEKKIKEEKTKINTDSLTKIGLYNFGNMTGVKALDVERNNLLKQIAAGLQKRTTTDGAMLA